MISGISGAPVQTGPSIWVHDTFLSRPLLARPAWENRKRAWGNPPLSLTHQRKPPGRRARPTNGGAPTILDCASNGKLRPPIPAVRGAAIERQGPTEAV